MVDAQVFKGKYVILWLIFGESVVKGRDINFIQLITIRLSLLASFRCIFPVLGLLDERSR